MRITTMALAIATVAVPGAALAEGKSPAPQFTMTGTTYSQDFDGLASSGTANTALPAGFQIVEGASGGAADGRYAAGNGSSNAGNVYSFGNSSDRALGSLASSGVTPTWFGGVFTNGTGGTIEALTFAYDGEQWRAGNSDNDFLRFQFSLDATELDNGTWTDFSALDFAALITRGNTALNGNLPANRTAISGTIGGLTIADGQSFGFRWVDVNSDGNDHGLAIDNLSINATLAVAAVPEPATWAMLILGFGVIGGALRRRRAVAFA